MVSISNILMCVVVVILVPTAANCHKNKAYSSGYSIAMKYMTALTKFLEDWETFEEDFEMKANNPDAINKYLDALDKVLDNLLDLQNELTYLLEDQIKEMRDIIAVKRSHLNF
ncbi:hypothetical protein CHUAL_007534 [Chamberlinius hualienensis]